MYGVSGTGVEEVRLTDRLAGWLAGWEDWVKVGGGGKKS